MKYRPSSAFLVCLAVVLVFAGIGFWFWSKLQVFPVHQWKSLSFSEILRGVKFDRFGRAPEQVTADSKRIRELKQKLLAEFPDLVIHGKPVPDERNGFRLLCGLSHEMEEGKVRITSGLDDGLRTTALWEPDAMRAALTENGELIARIESIAALPDRSLSNMPQSYGHYFSGAEVKRCADVLMAKARLAAEAKDEAEALRLVAAALNIASHLDQVEAPDFSNATIALLIDRGARESVITQLLPALGREADLSRWRAILSARPDYTADSYSRILRGEWHAGMDRILAPSVVECIMRNSADEVEAFHRTTASQTTYRIRSLAGQNREFLHSMLKPPWLGAPLPVGIRHSVDTHWITSDEWKKSYVRAGTLRAQNLAALDLLILEKSGAALTADSAARVTLEPLSGQPFLYDPVTRTLTASPTIAGDLNVMPLTLPW